MVESTPRFWYFEWDRSETIFGDFSSRPTQIQRGQEKFPDGGGEHEECRRESSGAPLPPPPVQVPPLRPNLGPYGFGQLSQFEDDT